MKPIHHLVFAVFVVTVFFTLFIPEPVSWQILFLAAVSGFLPDFDHRKWIWKLVAVAVFVGFFLLFLTPFETFFAGNFFNALLASLAVSALIAWIIYVTEPFRMEIWELTPKKRFFHGSGTIFLILYTLIIFAATTSVVYALAAFLGYSSHWVLDWIAYETKFGRRFLAGYKQWWMPMAWHVERIKAEKTTEKAREAREKAVKKK